MNYNLNQGQKDAAEAFFSFLFSDDKEFIISGPAGVGKTYLMNYIIDNTMPRYLEMCKLVGLEPEYTGVVMTATTNKAAEVLAAATGRPTKTVHSFFNLRVYDDHGSGERKLTKNCNWKVHENLIIFVDECSMIDTALYEILHEGTAKCKLVFVGDRFQLAPVKESLSPVYKQGSPLYELTQPMRNAEQPALINICQQLRTTVETGVFSIQLKPGVLDHLDDSQMQWELYGHFINQTQDHRILGYTNKRVIEYNDYIRKIRLLPEEYQEGEYLINANGYSVGTRTLSVEASVSIIDNAGSNFVWIDPGVRLDVNFLELEDQFGGRWNNVPIPTNKTHYNELLKYYKKIKNWERFFFLKNHFIDLRPRDAATVHKSQGSTYDSVFIDLGNLSTCHQPNQVARMLYVAFSRAKSRVFLYGKLADKYGGIILP